MSQDSSKRTLFIVFLTVFMDLIGFGIIIPIQPFLAESLGAMPSKITLLGASFSLMQFLFAPFWGRLSDVIGRRPVILGSIVLTAIGYSVFASANQLWLLFIARMIAGMGSANIGAAQAIIADSTPPEKRAKGMGIIGAAFGLGFIFGPAMGGMLGQISFSAPAWAAAALCVLNFLFAYFWLPETYPPEKRAQGTQKSHSHAFSLSMLKHAMRHVNVGKIFTSLLFYTVAFSMMEQVLGLFIQATWITDSENLRRAGREAALLTSYVLIVVGITATIVQGGLIGRLAKRFGERKLLFVGSLIIGWSLFCIPLAGTTGYFPLLMAVCAFMATGTGIMNPSLTSLLSQSVDKDEQGGTMGLGQSISALGRVIGPTFAGVLFEMGTALPFRLGGSLLFICTLLILALAPPKPQLR